ncbi:MAG: DUF6132 family protein [Nitrospinota bacterium]|nr:hypothetical protein [Nitrospinota bacterium]
MNIINTAIGGVIGGILGYIFRCSGGTCPLRSTPLRSTIYGVVLGALIGSTIK